MLTVPPARTHRPKLDGLDPLTLAGTVSARICHDLAGSLGALTGTLEMAAEEGDADALRLSLALAQELAARLRLLRAAWGADTDLPALESLHPGFPGSERLRLDTLEFTASDERVRRLALGLMLTATTALPRGGLIRVAGTDESISVSIEGQRAAWPEVLKNCLASDSSLLEACEVPRAMAVALVCLQARSLGMDIILDDETHLCVS